MFRRLTEHLQGYFDPTIRYRGHHYFEEGRVNVINLKENEFEVQVKGTKNYFVTLELESTKSQVDMWVDCECPYFESSGACKHVWATILTAERDGFGNSFLSQIIVLREHGYSDSKMALIKKHLDKHPLVEGNGINLDPLSWQSRLTEISGIVGTPQFLIPSKKMICKNVYYVLDIASVNAGSDLFVHFYHGEENGSEVVSGLKPLRLNRSELETIENLEDRDLIAVLLGKSMLSQEVKSTFASLSTGQPISGVVIPSGFVSSTLQKLSDTKRLLLSKGSDSSDLSPLRWHSSILEFRLRLEKTGEDKYSLNGLLVDMNNEKKTMNLDEPEAVHPHGLMILEGNVSELKFRDGYRWLSVIQSRGPIEFTSKDQDGFFDTLTKTRTLTDISIPKSLKWVKELGVPVPSLRVNSIHQDRNRWGIEAQVSFQYGASIADPGTPPTLMCDLENKKLISRNITAEVDRLREIGEIPGVTRTSGGFGDSVVALSPTLLPKIFSTLAQLGWAIKAPQLKLHTGKFPDLRVGSSLDWFELNGNLDFGDMKLTIPEALKALDKEKGWIDLGKGQYGLISEMWVKKLELLSRISSTDNGTLRIPSHHALLIDELFENRSGDFADKKFVDLVARLRNFKGIDVVEIPKNLKGKLRHYQKEGLSWLNFLREYGFGGCLADDMGLGKTIQTLAVLQLEKNDRKKSTEKIGPSLVVAPKTLVENWEKEAKQFTPNLKTFVYAGSQRIQHLEKLSDYDLVICTYGILRQDIEKLVNINFNFVILDEAQFIKNEQAQSARAAKLLKAKHRLALSGTPVENHLGDLFSIFDFLNPGLGAKARNFKTPSDSELEGDDLKTQKIILSGLRPFILRRTKGEVLKELPKKTEQILYCELDSSHQKRYDELRDYYRNLLTDQIEHQGLAKSKIQVLEALLRLRQMACHPKLVDKTKTTKSSAKLETLVAHLKEISESGQKALVFSQFTSHLALIREALDELGIKYLYLDGKTTDRQKLVTRFQETPDEKIFLISLKAGGFGLNLTAASYCFLMDPWWNPAVEAQAVDRTHRIGQLNPVFSYRLIAKGTVEEKILELQKSKAKLSESVLTSDGSWLKTMKFEDLRYILS